MIIFNKKENTKKYIFEKSRNKGMMLIEILFYISIFTILSVAFINGLITMMKSFTETTIQADFLQSSVMFERMSREIRQSESIDPTSTSTSLKLNSTDELGQPKTIEFLLSGNDLQFKEDSILTGNLNVPNINVTSLTFSEITSAQSEAVRIEMSVQNTRDRFSRTENFYNTVVLRGGYED